MKRTSKAKKTGAVVWAVDPFEEECRPSPSGLRILSRWVKRAGLELLPVYVVSPSPREISQGHVAPLEDAKATVVRYLRAFGRKDLAEPVVLLDETGSRPGAVRSLLGLADARKASWIVVSSHGRSGMGRLMLGSFAETLLRQAHQPVLFLSPKPRPLPSGNKLEKALFPTDFSVRSFAAYRQFLAEARRERFQVVVFHSLVAPAPALDGMLGMGSPLPENYFAEQEQWAKQEGERWMKLARRVGVPARFVLRDGGLLGYVSKDILDMAAKERASVIAMASLSGPLARFVVGSAPYEVFRAQRFPVWIYGPQGAPETSKREIPAGKEQVPGSRPTI